MNKELYERIKTKLDSLEGEWKEPNNVRHLLGQEVVGKKDKDLFTTIYAFYEYMNDHGFNFINEQKGWIDFYQDNLSNYLTMDTIKSSFDDIVSDEKLLGTILEVCNENVKKNLYQYAKVENSLHVKTGSKKYTDVYKKIEESLIKQGVIENPNKVDETFFSGDKTSKSIDEEIEGLKKRQADLEAQKVQRRDSLFKEASNSIGIKEEKLIKRVGKDESLNIDRIEVDSRLVSKLAANSAIAATMPQNFYQRMKAKAHSSRTFNNLELEILDNDGLSTLKVVKKENIFDKIASSDNALVRAIYNSAKKKLSLLKQLVKPSKEVNAIIRQAIVNTSRKIKESTLKTVNEVKLAYDELRENVNEVYQETKADAANKINDFANRVSDYSASVREKASEALYNMGDKVAPNRDVVDSTPESLDTNETYTYVNTSDENNKKIIVRAATKVGEMPALIEEKSSKKM